MALRRRRLLQAGAAASLALPAWLRHVHARAGAEPRFGLGVASGQPRADRVVLWTRLMGDDLPAAVPVHWELAEDERFARVVARGTESAVAADAMSVHAEPAGLAADRPYWYRFRALGQDSPVGLTRTAPAPDAAVARLRLAVASCQRYDVNHYAAWRDVVAFAPDLVLFVGDYLYEYPFNPLALRPHVGGAVRSLEGWRARYAQYKSDPLLQAAHAAAPWIVIWDDHEVENDHAGTHSARRDPDFPALRAAAYRAWWEHQPVPAAWRPVDGALPLFGRLDWGRLARLHWLDTRQFRDPQACPPPWRGGSQRVRPEACAALRDPRRSMLGAAQERWLAEGWSTAQPWNLLAQTTLMAPFSVEARQGGAEGGAAGPGEGRFWTDGWDGYAATRQRLLDGLVARGVTGAVVLGGDLHAHLVADLHAVPEDPSSPIVASEFCGTSIASRGPSQLALGAVRRLNPHLHHARGDERGSLCLTLTPTRLEALLRAVDDPRDPASGAHTQARFVVEAGRPGVLPG